MKKVFVLAVAALVMGTTVFAQQDEKAEKGEKKCKKGSHCCKKEGKSCSDSKGKKAEATATATPAATPAPAAAPKKG